jgi:hypothetical protein
MGVTDDYYTDGRVLSVRPSVIISPTKLIPGIDRSSPSVKLFNGVVKLQEKETESEALMKIRKLKAIGDAYLTVQSKDCYE